MVTMEVLSDASEDDNQEMLNEITPILSFACL